MDPLIHCPACKKGYAQDSILDNMFISETTAAQIDKQMVCIFIVFQKIYLHNNYSITRNHLCRFNVMLQMTTIEHKTSPSSSLFLYSILGWDLQLLLRWCLCHWPVYGLSWMAMWPVYPGINPSDVYVCHSICNNIYQHGFDSIVEICWFLEYNFISGS